MSIAISCEIILKKAPENQFGQSKLLLCGIHGQTKTYQLLSGQIWDKLFAMNSIFLPKYCKVHHQVPN
ncbi:hypothetical protein MTR_5g090260 [Medicago truncatula]|uniref:Uncharacterized protein n=1 Tax=Medicago truncatula TaxID=3880 RepID=G7KCZ9_MEDTR|nr:hypothetical protein MTR_5g090260 [Medicago truncatula]